MSQSLSVAPAVPVDLPKPESQFRLPALPLAEGCEWKVGDYVEINLGDGVHHRGRILAVEDHENTSLQGDSDYQIRVLFHDGRVVVFSQEFCFRGYPGNDLVQRVNE